MSDDTHEQRTEWLAKADILTEALPYMRQHAGKVIVVKYGGHAMGDTELSEAFARDIVLLKQVGLNPIVVQELMIKENWTSDRYIYLYRCYSGFGIQYIKFLDIKKK